MAGNFLEADLDTFFNQGEFAHLATVTPAGGVGREIRVLFDEEMAMESGIGYSQHAKHCEIETKTTDLDGIKEGDLIAVQGFTYEIVFRSDSGTGTSTLVVRKRK